MYSEMELLDHVCVCVLVTQSCLTLRNSMQCSLPGSSVHGIHYARILEWVALPPPGLLDHMAILFLIF